MGEPKDEKTFNDEVEAEKRKISELFRELKNKGGVVNDDKLNWMYKNPSECVEREEYLLGRTVDKALDSLTGKDLQSTSNELANLPKRVVGAEGSTEQIDMHKKVHEDPLFAMRQREIAARKQLLNNPLKVKEIKKMIEVESKKKEKIEKKQRKEARRRVKNERVNYLLIKELRKLNEKVNVKSLLTSLSESDSDDEPPTKSLTRRKQSKRKYSSSSESSDTDSESDSDSDEKGKKHSKNKKETRRKRRDSSTSSDIPRKTSEKKLKKKKKRVKYESPSDSSSDSDTSEDQNERNKSKQKVKSLHRSLDKSRAKKRKHKKTESSEESSPVRSRSHKNRKRDEERLKKSSKSISSKSSTNKTKQRTKSSSESNDGGTSQANSVNKSHKPFGLSMLDGSKPDKTEKKIVSYKKEETAKSSTVLKKHKPLTEKEKEEELKEMLENAKWRKKERESDYARHKKNRVKEDKLDSFDELFVKNQMALLASSGSMADRVKSKMNTVQRSRSTMDSNFVRK